MTNDQFADDGARLLTTSAFDFSLDGELSRAVRSQRFLTLVTFETHRRQNDLNVVADDGMVENVAQVVSREVRATDPLGRTDTGSLALVLLDADFHNSTRVIDRVIACIDRTRFPAPIQISVGAASYPTHAVDADSLKRQARVRHVASWHSRS
jgi:GGDEF domain-containing protein